jgi:hypothetical protein
MAISASLNRRYCSSSDDFDSTQSSSFFSDLLRRAVSAALNRRILFFMRRFRLRSIAVVFSDLLRRAISAPLNRRFLFSLGAAGDFDCAQSPVMIPIGY